MKPAPLLWMCGIDRGKAHHRRELFDIDVEQRLIDSEPSARMYRVEFRYPMLDVPLVEFEKQELQELLRSPFLQKYCKGGAFNMQNDDSKFMVKHFRSCLSLCYGQ